MNKNSPAPASNAPGQQMIELRTKLQGGMRWFIQRWETLREVHPWPDRSVEGWSNGLDKWQAAEAQLRQMGFHMCIWAGVRPYCDAVAQPFLCSYCGSQAKLGTEFVFEGATWRKAAAAQSGQSTMPLETTSRTTH